MLDYTKYSPVHLPQASLYTCEYIMNNNLPTQKPQLQKPDKTIKTLRLKPNYEKNPCGYYQLLLCVLVAYMIIFDCKNKVSP